VPVVADERVRGREITLGPGEHGLALAVDADEILQALDASVADISDPEPATQRRRLSGRDQGRERRRSSQ
jgi:hypothetical protein